MSNVFPIPENIHHFASDPFELFEPADKTEEYLIELNRINFQIAELSMMKKKLTKHICAKLGIAKYDDAGNITWVEHDGQQSKEIGRFSATFTTKSGYKVDAKEYKILESRIRPEFNPVRKTVKLDVVKKKLDDVYTYGSAEDIALLDEFLTMKYSDASISLTPIK